ncbi:myc protein [Condylostylus longicornis]|uniref:myc protein n=1 Tax=Condylostylus longicornis TaxID=2530218 RepID=UPI00244E11D4|nr:myc protein [Condylostylus longicornis]XP_055390144.1 myc protein [Condylostylus longicornis]
MGTFDCWNAFSLSNDETDRMEFLLDREIDTYVCNNYDDLSFIHSDLYNLDTYRSIHDDIKQIESSGSTAASDASVTSEPEIDIKPKTEIRNVDCMWSGLGNLWDRKTTNQRSNNQQQTQSQQQQQQRQQNSSLIQNNGVNSNYGLNGINNSSNTNNNSNNGGSNNGGISTATTTKLSAKNIQNIPPGASLLINSRLNQQKKSQSSPSSKYHNNSNNNSISTLIPNILASDFIKDRESMQQQQSHHHNHHHNNYNNNTSNLLNNNNIILARPDTPLSLDDDAPEFKHSVDLAACITGSNNICLDLNNIQDTTDKMIINKLKEQLEDTSTDNIDIRNIIPGNNNNKKRSLTEVLHAIGSIDKDYFSNDNNNFINLGSNNIDLLTIQQHNNIINQQKQKQTSIYDYGSNTAPDSELSQSSSESEGDDLDDDDDDEDDDGEYDDDNIINNSDVIGVIDGVNGGVNDSCGNGINNKHVSNIFRIPSTSQFRKNNNYTTYIDHSYTRSNESNVDVVGIGLETPSDSDEEIDVVSVGDKKLPTNPSDKDRKALQNKVANKFSARIVKTPNGIRTIPPRKRGTFDPPYAIMPISNMTTSPIKTISVGGGGSNSNPRYNNSQCSNTNINNNNSNNLIKTQQQNIDSSNNINNSNKYNNNNNNNNNNNSSNNSISAGRKRNVNNNNSTILNIKNQQNDEYLPPSKRSRNNNNNTTITNNSNNNSNNNSSSSNNTTTSKSSNKKSSNSKKNYDMEEQDTIEKRNLHNDMERQRRIGLKNLFEELKQQIPSIKDKERAPKVHILREAAKLCEQLMHDEKTILQLKNQLIMQVHRRKEILEAKYK